MERTPQVAAVARASHPRRASSRPKPGCGAPPTKSRPRGSRRAAWYGLAGVAVTIGAGLALRAAQGSAPALELFDARALFQVDARDADARRRTWDDQHLLAALQGIVNRDQPRLYAFVNGPGGRTDRYWLERLRAPGQWLADRPTVDRTNLLESVRQHRRFVNGVVVWDERVPASALVASTAAGVEALLPVRHDPRPGSLYRRLVEDPDGLRLPVRLRLLRPDGSPLFTGERTGSAKCDAVLWAVDRYLKTRRCNPALLAYYPDAWWLAGRTSVPPGRTLLCSHDYFIARRGFFFDLGPWDDETPDDDPGQPLGTDARTLRALLAAAHAAASGGPIHVGGFTPWDQKYTDHTGRKHGGVPTEWHYAEILSGFNAYMDADAPGLHSMANASVFQHYPLAQHYPQTNLPTEGSLRAQGFLDAVGRVVAHPYATVYVGDYDSAAWLYTRLPEIWDDPDRGRVPLGWAFNPALERRFPVGLAFARATATSNDFFVAGDSGYGYLNPGALVPPRKWSGLPSGLAAWERLCREGYRRWDLRITGFVIDGDAPPMNHAVQEAYARFSPGGVVAQKIPRQSLVQGVPFLRMGADLSDPAQGAKAIAAALPPDTVKPGFGIFRTILWSPGQHAKMFDLLRQERPDLRIVEPHTLFELLRRHLRESPAAGAADGAH